MDIETASPTERWHIVTPEYPPQPGGVSDYTYVVANDLAAHGDEVHVWCPAHGRRQIHVEQVIVHPSLGALTAGDLRRTGNELNRFTGSRRLLVQWVPHGYGYRSMNLLFCLWIWSRAHFHGDDVEIMVHEPYLDLWTGSWKQNLAAAVHRLMTIVMLAAVRRAWLSIPSWESRLRPYTLGRRISFRWLPVPSNIPVLHDVPRVAAIRSRYASTDTFLIGHFGTYGSSITAGLEPILLRLCAGSPRQAVLLIGQNSQEYRQKLIEREPQLTGLIHATGALSASDTSLHLSACDVLAQPFKDGVSSRRTTVMAGLSHGKPIVTSCGRLTESCWKESAAVALAPAGDVTAFVALLDKLGSQVGERVRLGQAARDLYAARFDLALTVAALRSGSKTRSDQVDCVPA